MSVAIPDSHRDLLDGPICVTLGTVMPDGQPQLSVVWCSYDGSHVLVNTSRHRQKEKNMSARPMATLLALDPQNDERYLEVRGRVEEITEEGAIDHVNQLAKLYTGADTFYGGVAPASAAAEQIRVICKIKPQKVYANG